MKEYNDSKLKKDLENYYDSFIKLKKYGIGQKIVCDIGEHFAERIFGIRLIHYKSNPSVDGIDKKGKRVQIKTRHRHKENLKIHVFRPFDTKKLKNIDYALLIILGEKFWLEEVWKVEREALQKNLSKKSSDSFNLTSGIKKMEGVKRVYPK